MSASHQDTTFRPILSGEPIPLCNLFQIKDLLNKNNVNLPTTQKIVHEIL